jgi:hypothetical protein
VGAQYESSISEQWEILFIKSQVDCWSSIQGCQ